jgi:DNA-binding HxlR family transcriptional regulator
MSLEMTSLSQSPRDRILWLLTNNGGKMERASLRRKIGWRYAVLDPALEELEKEGRIKITLGRQGGSISLKK